MPLHYKVMWIILVGSIFGVAMMVRGCRLCDNEIIATYPSPDGTNTAYVRVRDCGAITTWVTSVYLNEDKPENYVMSYEGQGAPQMHWEGNNTLVIEAGRFKDHFEPHVGDVDIIYRTSINSSTRRIKEPQSPCRAELEESALELPEGIPAHARNLHPRVSYFVGEDGSVSKVKIIDSTESHELDAQIVKSVGAWRYKPQKGCRLDVQMHLSIDVN
jgi:TonB family protein